MKLTEQLLREYYEKFVRPHDEVEQRALLTQGLFRLKQRALREGFDLGTKPHPAADLHLVDLFGPPEPTGLDPGASELYASHDDEGETS